MRKGLTIAAASVAVLCVTTIAVAHLLAPRIRIAAKDQAQKYLQSYFQSSVEFSDFHVTLFPRIHLIVGGLVLRHRGRTDIPPLVEVREATIDADLSTLLGRRHEVRRVRLEGLQIHIPPRIPGGPPLIERSDSNLAEKYPIVIDEIDADDALLVLLRKATDAGKPPNEFAIHELVMDHFSFDHPAAFHALLTNPKPEGEIHCDGQFGPWRADQPGETPLRGNYTFRDADLGTLRGIQGRLSSTGRFSGPLDYLSAEGVTDTPNFALRTSGHPMALHTDFTAIIDGTNGNTVLTNVTAKFLRTSLVAQGEVVDLYPTLRGRTIALNAVSSDARVEDLLLLAVKSDHPIMTGSARLKTKILIPEGDSDLVDRLQLDGQFGLGEVHFTNAGVQSKVDALSRRGQGQPKNLDITDVMSGLRGNLRMANGSMTFSDLTFQVEGASVSLAGTYNIDNGQMDFRGKLRMDAKLSETMTGWKSVVLKPFDSFFKGKRGGTEIPIKITGTRDHPVYGADFNDEDNKK
jgi:AsmA-like C-terminal region